MEIYNKIQNIITGGSTLIKYTGKAVRIKKGETIRGLAKKAGIAPSTITKWENGSAMPDLIVLDKVAEALDASPWDLILYTNSKKTSPENIRNICSETEIFKKAYDNAKEEKRPILKNGKIIDYWIRLSSVISIRVPTSSTTNSAIE